MLSDGLINGSMDVIEGLRWSALSCDSLEEGELFGTVLIFFYDASFRMELNEAYNY